MAGAHLSPNHPDILQALRTVHQTLGTLEPVLLDVGEYLLGSTRRRFREQRAPDGTPWAPLSATTLSRKRKNRGKILIQEGYLRGTLTYQVLGGSVLQVGTARLYGAVHQFGARKGQFGRTRRGGPIPWGDIPAREYLGLSADDRTEVLAIIGDHLQRAAGLTR